MLVYQKTTYCYKHVRVSAWLSGKPSVQDIINSYINENTGSNLEKSQKKGFEIRALKRKKKLGVVPKKPPVAQRQSVYNTVIYPTRFAKVRI